jgi:Alpha galactosidase A
MLEVGNGNLTLDESKSHFALWALAKAPLLLGNDLMKINKGDDIWQVITNQHLIALHQNARVQPATCFIGCDINSTSTRWSAFATRVPPTGRQDGDDDYDEDDVVVIIVNWSNIALMNILPLRLTPWVSFPCPTIIK